jgi:hypothetical protein
MWHSHSEKEIVNGDIFPGGMMTMMMIMTPVTNAVMTAPMNSPKKIKP